MDRVPPLSLYDDVKNLENIIRTIQATLNEKDREMMASRSQVLSMRSDILALRDALTQSQTQLDATQQSLHALESHVLYNSTRIHAYQDHALRRLLLFLRASASFMARDHKLLRSPVSQVAADTAIVQGRLKSRKTDATLREARLLDRYLSGMNSSSSPTYVLHPNRFAVHNERANSINRISFVFRSFSDLCAPLNADLSTRRNAIFRKRTDQLGDCVSCQVIGYHHVRHEEDVATNAARVIVVGGGARFTEFSSSSTMRFITQDSMEWSNGAFETDLEYHAKFSVAQGPQISPESIPSLDFAIMWEETKPQSNRDDADPDTVIGSLRIYVPLVVFRGRRLANKVQSFFETRLQDEVAIGMES